MTDPRVGIIDERLKGVRNIIAVSGGKGGVGKSLTASLLALTLAKEGYKVGLFDLDFTSPSTHLILGAGRIQPKEERGIKPSEIHGLKYMSIVYYSGNFASPLRGSDFSNALIELLAVTRWDILDFLVLDMPPGISDATLDVIRYVKGVRFLIVTSPSQLALETVRKLASLLNEMKVPIIGVIENMRMDDSRTIRQKVKGMNLDFWGTVPFDARIEEAIGHANRLAATTFGKKVAQMIEEYITA